MWKSAKVLSEVSDYNGYVLFNKDELITVFKSTNRFECEAWEVINHNFRNGFIFDNGCIEILGDAFTSKEEI